MVFQGKLKVMVASVLAVACVYAVPTATMHTWADDTAAQAEDAQSDFDKDAAMDQIEDLNQKIESIKQQQNAITAQINAAQDEKERQQIQKNQLDNQIYLTNQQISLLNQRIELLSGQIEQREQEVSDKQQEIEENYDLFLQRMRQMYMNSSGSSTLGLLLGVEDFGEFLTRAEAMRRVAEQDKELIETLYNDKEELQSMLDQIELDKQEIESSKQELDAQNQILASQSSQIQQQIQTLEGMEQTYLADQANLQKQLQAAREEIDAIYAQLESEGEFVGGEWLWPVNGYKTITSYYGWRFNNTDFHTGIDISGGGIYRKNALASNAGRVQLVGYQAGGYGNYVIIDHGGGYSTLYAHLDQPLVSVGQQVARGEAIGLIGTTGWSTGPHLHFEIRVNGQDTNPLQYF